MQIQVKNGYIIGFAVLGGFPDGIEVTQELIASIDPAKIGFYRYEDGKAVFDSEKWEQAQSTQQTGGFIPSAQASSLEVSRLLLSQLSLDTNDKKLKISGLFEQWTPGIYQVGDIRNAGNQTWECYQACDSSIYPDSKPGSPAWFTFWKPLHGQSPETARPFVPVQGAHDIYKVGEYMVWTDGQLYECVQNTNFSPSEFAPAWKACASATSDMGDRI